MSVSKVVVNLPGLASYDVRIGPHILEGLGARVKKSIPHATATVLVSDTNVAPLYAAKAHESLVAAGLRTLDITIPAGEESKSIACLSEIWNAMAQARLDRESVVVALGGGVVGDLAGFAAASYMRGIHLVQVPTSLLAMVDSSVGGKTGIDLSSGKNLVGAFKQPAYVCASTDVLATLPEREWVCGCAEIAKASLIDSDDFFFWLVEHAAQLSARNEDVTSEAIVRSVVFKANVVAADVEERAGVRACLNYGHTLGHAIETLAGFGTFSHGAAVAEGMRFAARLGAALVGTPLELVEEQDALLDSLGLPVLDFKADADAILDFMRADKKNRGGVFNFILPEDVGQWVLRAVDEETLVEHLSAWAASK